MMLARGLRASVWLNLECFEADGVQIVDAGPSSLATRM
jgi:hypothetical protein